MNGTKTKFTRRCLSLVLIAVMLGSVMALSSCEMLAQLFQREPLVIFDSDTTIVIRCEETDGEATLADYMAKLKTAGEIEFTVENGMITSINGIENPADYSSCWMLYTSDSDFSSSEWGTVEYQGVEYGSAILGAEALVIKPEQTYIWVFKSFDD